MKPDAVNAAHIARVSAVDALVAEPIPLTGVMLVAERDGSSAVAIAAYTEAAPDTAARTWDATRRHSLDVRFAGPDRAAVLGDVLDQWLDGIDSTAGDTDSAAVVELPSRDTEAVLALVHRGFVPVNVLAIRTAGRPSPPAETDVRIRPATPADLDVAVELNLEVVRYDAPFGKVTPRPETAEVLRNQLTYLFGLSEPSVWLAERNDQVVGLVHVQLPPTSAWVNRYAHARLGDVGYLACLGVREGTRGRGVGGALAAHAHAVLDAEVPATLLHHALPNPRSTPFWYRHGYRPLWTAWTRRPARR